VSGARSSAGLARSLTFSGLQARGRLETRRL